MGLFDSSANLMLVAEQYHRDVAPIEDSKRSTTEIMQDDAKFRRLLQEVGSYKVDELADGRIHLLITTTTGTNCNIPRDTPLYEELIRELSGRRHKLVIDMATAWLKLGYQPNLADFYRMIKEEGYDYAMPNEYCNEFGTWQLALKATGRYMKRMHMVVAR